MRFLFICVLLLTLFPDHCKAGSQYIRRKPGNSSVIVFVHGVTGDAKATWTNERTNVYWPQMMAADPALSSEDIYVYEYPSRRLGKSYTINEIAEDLRLMLSVDVLPDHQRVIFLAHSMGGLVVRQYLLKNRDEARRTPFIYFFATPTTGSPMAILAKHLSGNPQFQNLRPIGVDETLANLLNDWLAAKEVKPIASYCAYETQPMFFGQVVVEQQSATNLCNRRLDPMDTDHAQIVKPESARGKAYLAFMSAYAEAAGAHSPGSGAGLRADLQNVKQTLKQAGPPVRAHGGEAVLCDSLQLDLVLAHPGPPLPPILVNSIAIQSRPVDRRQLGLESSCKVDPLSSRPHGITERGIYFVTITDRGTRARFMEKADRTEEVQLDNVLRSESGSKTIALGDGAPPLVSLDFAVHSTSSEPQEITFTVSYDQAGEKRVGTRRVLLWK